MIKKLKPEFISGLGLLEKAYSLLENPETVGQGLDLLFDGLIQQRNDWEKQTWRSFGQKICLTHQIRALLHQDPVTYRSYAKPRGYAGDAVLLDFLYRHAAVQEDFHRATRIGQAICSYIATRPSAVSVRWRRDYLAALIDQISDEVSNAEMLSVACGHLREAQHSSAMRNNRVKRFVAFDQDSESLQTVEATKNGSRIECYPGRIQDMIMGAVEIGKFDFIYSAGLYDYLRNSAARLLTKSLFDMLKPGGRLLIANFADNNTECGYMEAFMDWELIYRSREAFIKAIGPMEKELHDVFYDDNGYVVYLEFRRNDANRYSS